jgi:hypothetical protein
LSEEPQFLFSSALYVEGLGLLAEVLTGTNISIVTHATTYKTICNLLILTYNWRTSYKTRIPPTNTFDSSSASLRGLSDGVLSSSRVVGEGPGG